MRSGAPWETGIVRTIEALAGTGPSGSIPRSPRWRSLSWSRHSSRWSCGHSAS